ncbi:hypothetical protein [Streptomyces sp. NPDC059063]|uniref:hypothetical protein n=1 Tax=Streptomyces sp. NPDC059063 TaxID=3346712 RepID=UPI0036B74937
MKLTTTMDAVGRRIRLGDTVGGATDQGQIIVGHVTEIADGRVKVAVDAERAEREEWLTTGRAFFVDRSLDGQLRALGNNLAHSGPALFHLTAVEDDTVTMTRLDHAAPEDPREAGLCRALITHALTVMVRGEQATTTTSQGPALVYAGSDHATLWRVDQTTIDDPREWALCNALLRHALDLCHESAPVHADEKSQAQR